MSIRKNSGSDVKSSVVIVAIKASKEISRSALIWALTNVVQPGDCVRLLVVIPNYSSSNFSFLMLVFTFNRLIV